MRNTEKKFLRPSVAVIAALVVGAFAVVPSSALAAKPANITAPTVSPVLPHVGTTMTANPGEWTGSPTFTYQWRRGGYKIEGATGTTYTPTAADVGAPFSVTVTAKNADGEVTATSKMTEILVGRFQVCGKVSAGAGAFEDAHCTKAGGSKSYAWNWLSGSAPIKYTTGSPYKFFWPSGGIEMEVECVKSTGTGSINSSNRLGPEMTGTLTLSNCAVAKPAGQGCKVVGGTIYMSSLLGQPTNELTVSPLMNFSASGGTVANIGIENCGVSSYNKNYPVTGTLPARVNSAKQQLVFEHTSAYVLGQVGWFEGASGIEGENGEGIRVEA